MKKVHINAINRKLCDNESDFIRSCNQNYTQQLSEIADQIEAEYKTKPILLLSGPSGAGKTTTAKKIEEILDNRGIKTHTISMDNYFLPESDFANAIGENGEVDYESPYRINIPLLNKHMEMLSNCEEVTVPRFVFSTQESVDGFNLKREKNDIVVFEGIHALNPLVTSASDGYARCMYVSVRTRIEFNNGQLLQPKFIRLMRRLMRDGLYRGRSVEQTLDMFDSVEHGENKYIMPYKQRAEFSVDTFIPYETAVYKELLLNKLEAAAKTYPDFERFTPMTEALRSIKGVSADNIPADSLVREFIGGSKYSY